MNATHVVTGTITDTKTITLDEAIPTNTGRVRVWVEMLPTGPKPTMEEAVAEIRRRQAERGHVPMTTEQVHALFADPLEPDEETE